MYKRIIIFVLLFVNVFFYSCSSKKELANESQRGVASPEGEVSVPDKDIIEDENKKITYEELKQQHYEMQPESVKLSMEENAERSKEQTPLRKKKKRFNLFRKKDTSCTDNVNDAVVNDGVRDYR